MAFQVRIIDSADERRVGRLLQRRPRQNTGVMRQVARIVADVQRRGDAAVIEYARRLDQLTQPIEVTRDEMLAAERQVPPSVRRAISLAATNIRRVAVRQLPQPWSLRPAEGIRISQRVLPLDRVGCYVPGGRYPLPSSLLMTATPARVAGVKEIIAVCPRPDATIMFAARVAGVSQLFRLGGPHAIAALAYGTRTIPAVDKIVGPGNAYVAAAKSLVSADCAIDFHAGPSEIVVVSSTGRPAWIAADLIAQAEHDPDARAILLTPSRRLAEAVARHLAARMPAAGPAQSAMRMNGGVVVTRTLAEAIDLCNRMAPEHVVCDTDQAAGRITRAGTIFVGEYSAQAAGDYATGSNHVLPTNGAARARGGLSASDFVRVATVQHVTSRGLRTIGAAVITLANAEGLSGHAASVAIRIDPDTSSTSGRGATR